MKLYPDIPVRPPYLTTGDKVAIVSPAKTIDKEHIDNAVSVFESWGLNVELGPHVLSACNYYAGTHSERATDLQYFIHRNDIAAIICSRGGYGSIHTLQYLDFSALQKHPKWFVGYSDITVFHSLLNSYLGIESLHATMPLDFTESEDSQYAVNNLKVALFGSLVRYDLPHHPMDINGKTSGRLIGGNLSVLYGLTGTPAEMFSDNCILFIEDVGESIHHIDRMMANLLYSGKLKKIKGLIVGGMTSIRDTHPPFGESAYKVIRRFVRDMGIPVVFGFPAGHIDGNMSLYLGRNCELNVTDNATRLTFLD